MPDRRQHRGPHPDDAALLDGLTSCTRYASRLESWPGCWGGSTPQRGADPGGQSLSATRAATPGPGARRHRTGRGTGAPAAACRPPRWPARPCMWMGLISSSPSRSRSRVGWYSEGMTVPCVTWPACMAHTAPSLKPRRPWRPWAPISFPCICMPCMSSSMPRSLTPDGWRAGCVPWPRPTPGPGMSCWFPARMRCCARRRRLSRPQIVGFDAAARWFDLASAVIAQQVPQAWCLISMCRPLSSKRLQARPYSSPISSCQMSGYAAMYSARRVIQAASCRS